LIIGIHIAKLRDVTTSFVRACCVLPASRFFSKKKPVFQVDKYRFLRACSIYTR